MKQNKPIFKKTLAFKLIDLGHMLVDVTPNERNPKYLIFYFEEYCAQGAVSNVIGALYPRAKLGGNDYGSQWTQYTRADWFSSIFNPDQCVFRIGRNGLCFEQ